MASLKSATAPRSVLIPALLAVAGLGWALTGERMQGMARGPGAELGDLDWFTVSWVLMTAAMMLPSLAPAAVTGARAQVGPVLAFVVGYLGAWTAAGLAGYTLVEGVRSLELGVLAWDEAGRYVVAGTVLAAAGYQVTQPKEACLRRCRCRRPFARDRSLRAGIEHGRFCVGCCWALMAALLALGAMSIAWMAVIAALITLERLLPWRRAAARGVALALGVLAIAVAVAPEDVPGLTVPGASGAMQAMNP